MLLDIIRDARIDLDLEPWNDPAESLFDWIVSVWRNTSTLAPLESP